MATGLNGASSTSALNAHSTAQGTPVVSMAAEGGTAQAQAARE
jgi:hypothetical protein